MWGGQILLKNILFRLAIPSIVFAIVLYFPKNFIRGIAFETETFLFDTIGGGCVWFTCSLTLAELLFFLCFLLKRRNIWLYFFESILLAIISFILFAYDFSFFSNPYVPWFYKTAMSATLIMAIGGLYWQYEIIIDMMFSIFKKLPLMLILIAYIVWTSTNNDYCGSLASHPLNIESVVGITIGVYLIIRVAKWINLQNQFVSYLGRHTIGLYFLSGAIPNFIAVIIGKFVTPFAALPIIIGAVSFVTAISIVWILDCICPFLFDLRILKKQKNC